MDTDRPYQEGPEDLPSELSFFSLSAWSRSDARSDAFERGDSRGIDLSYDH